MHSDFIERNPRFARGRRSLLRASTGMLFAFSKINARSGGQNTIQERAMSRSDMIFGVNVICAFAKPVGRCVLQNAAQNHARLTRRAIMLSTCKNNACKCIAVNLRCIRREFSGVYSRWRQEIKNFWKRRDSRVESHFARYVANISVCERQKRTAYLHQLQHP